MGEPGRNTTVCILGMHRSGTSCLAGSLEERGLFLGEVINFARFNRRGNKESPICMQINDEIMALNGGSWDNPPKSITWNDNLRQRRDAHIATYAGREIWGFKDPRTLFTLPFWLEALPNMRFVGTFRHPHAVARSLLRRGRALEPAVPPIQLWQLYNRKLLDNMHQFDIPLICFDWRPEKYARAVNRIAVDLGLQPASGGELEFYEHSLRSSDQDDGAFGPVREGDVAMYNMLRQHAIEA